MHLTRTLVTPQGATGVRRRLTTPSGHAAGNGKEVID